MKIGTPLIATILFTIFSGTSYASIIQYNNKALFTGNTSSVNIGALPSSGASGTTVGSLTFTDAPSTSIIFLDSTSIISGNELAVSGIESYNIDISGGAYALGFDAYEPTSTGAFNGCNVSVCVDSTFTLNLFDGANNVGGVTFNLLDDSLNFIGISSSLSFNRVEIREITGTNDNEYFGNFLIGTTPVTVPELPVVWLLLLGMLGFAPMRTRKLSNSYSPAA